MDIITLGKLLNFAENVVRKTGKHIVVMRNESHIDITYKDVGELVTSADFASDQIFSKAILYYYPNHRILSEENFTCGGDKERFDGPLWIVDPLDGTVNFAKGLPYFSISVAFAVDGIVLARGCSRSRNGYYIYWDSRKRFFL